MTDEKMKITVIEFKKKTKKKLMVSASKILNTNGFPLETNELIPPNRRIFSLVSNRIGFHTSALD